MSSLLDSTNPHGIRVVADRAPLRADVQAAFLKASRKATTGISELTRSTSKAASTPKTGRAGAKRTARTATGKRAT